MATQAVAVTPSKDELNQAHTWAQTRFFGATIGKTGKEPPFSFNYGGRPFADLVAIFEVVHLLFEAGELGIGEVKRDADDRLSRRAAPLVREINHRTEPAQALALELVVQALDESLDRRPFELESEFLDGLGQELLDVGRGFLEGAQRNSPKGNTKRAREPDADAR